MNALAKKIPGTSVEVLVNIVSNTEVKDVRNDLTIVVRPGSTIVTPVRLQVGREGGRGYRVKTEANPEKLRMHLLRLSLLRFQVRSEKPLQELMAHHQCQEED